MTFDCSKKIQELREELMQLLYEEHVYLNEKMYREQLAASESR